MHACQLNRTFYSMHRYFRDLFIARNDKCMNGQ